MTTRIRHVIERAYGPPQAPPAPYFQTMKESRGFLSWTAVMLVVLGTIQGTVVTVIWHLHARTAVLFIGAEILISLVWLPIAYTVMRIFEARLPRASRVGLVVVLGVASFFVEPIGVALLGRIGAPSPPYARRVLARLDTNVLFYLTLAGIAWAAAARRRHMASELAAARVQTALADAQLHVLTLQLHPHFLFNALNLISQLAYESVEAAQRTVANLRALLVESLRHAVHREVELHDELSFLGAYLEIQQARFRERLHVAISAPKELDDAAVPHLVLQPLVENAIVHGLQKHSSMGRLDISARRTGDRLIISVTDDGVGFAPGAREGMGLTNTRLRLDQLFGGDYRLSIAPGDKGTVVTVDIPYRRRASSRAASESVEDVAHTEITPDSVVRRVPGWLQVVAGWSAVAILWTELASVLPNGAAPNSSWMSTLASYMINAVLWIAITPFIVRLARRFEVAGMNRLRALRVHALAAVGVAIAHTIAWLVALYAVRSPAYVVILHSMFGWALWDLVAYVGVVAFATIATYSARARDTRHAMELARARLASARVATLRLRLQPAVLLNGLDALARVVAVSAELAEATITRMGDLLRMLLSRSDREFVSLEEDLELLDAYLDVVNSPRPVSGVARDIPRIEGAANAAVPAMLFPTLGAAMSGEVELLRVELLDKQLAVALRSGQRPVDITALDECAARLRDLYDGREHFSVERDDVGRTIVELAFPARAVADENVDTLTPVYDLATA